MSAFTKHSMVQELHPEGGKIVLLVLDGLGAFHTGRLKRFGA